MRRSVAAAFLVAGTTLPAASQTDPIQLKVDWSDCLALLEEYSGAYTKQGGEVLSEIERDGNRSVAIALKKELIVISCKRSFWSSEFTIDVAPL